jgi:hypothetical protein
MYIEMNYLNGLLMLVFRIMALLLLFTINASCQCYEGVTNREGIYLLHQRDSIYKLDYFSNFHGQYTRFDYDFKLSGKDTIVTFSAAGGFATSLVMKNKRFYIREEFPSSEDEIILLKRKNCARLKINKIPPERISKNQFPD